MAVRRNDLLHNVPNTKQQSKPWVPVGDSLKATIFWKSRMSNSLDWFKVDLKKKRPQEEITFPQDNARFSSNDHVYITVIELGTVPNSTSDK